MKRKIIAMTLIVVAVLLIAPVLYYFALRSNSDALWRIVSEQCLRSQLEQQTPGACLKVDLAERYVLFKDAKGPYHDLLMPTFPVAGLESPELGDSATPDFFLYAWSERGRLSEEANFPIRDQYLSLAVNSRYGRSQDHLHIHMACLRPEVYDLLAREASSISFDWTVLSEKIQGRRYLARRLPGDALARENPIGILNRHLQANGAAPGDFGLALTLLDDGDFVLLATGMNLLTLDLGSAEAIQDFTCAVAQPRP